MALNVSLSAEAVTFVKTAYDLGWVVTGFDWPAWKDTAAAATLLDDPEALAAASPDNLAKLLTVLIRQDRFCEGSLAAAYDSGLLRRIVHRAAELNVCLRA